jgi:peroxiredoxin (alkyl hydroperoxide reductase subunit C)
MDNFSIPLIGEKAPVFTADTTYGPINFPTDYKGKWVVFFSHPGDLSPDSNRLTGITA